MNIDAQIEKVRSDAARKIRRLKEKKKKDAQRLENESRKRICDFIIGESTNLQMQFVANIDKGEVLKLWSWLQKRASAEITRLQKAPREAQAPDPGNHTSTPVAPEKKDA